LCLIKSSDYNLILNFFHKPQIIIFVLPVCNPSIFQQELHILPARCSWLIACLEILKRYCRLTYESPLVKKCSINANLSRVEMAFLNAVSFFKIFSPVKLIKNSNSLGDILVKFLYNLLTEWKFKCTSKFEPLYTSLLVYIWLGHHRCSLIFFFKA